MERKKLTPITDGIIGFFFGIAAIIPGIAGGTILLITGAFKKVVNAVANLFSKNFFRNFIILLPFGIGAILAFAALVIPLNLAMEYCMFTIVCLFAGLIIGTIPTITDKIKGKPVKSNYIAALVISLTFTAIIGVLSVIFSTNDVIEEMMIDRPWYLYVTIACVGFIASSGLIVPGFSGSMLLLALCFYQPILSFFKFNNFGSDIALIFIFLIAAIIGFVIFSKIMNKLIEKHPVGTYFASIGLIIGSLVAVFVNGQMFDYLSSEEFNIVDKILGPIIFVVAIVLGLLFVRYIHKHPEFEENAQN